MNSRDDQQSDSAPIAPADTGGSRLWAVPGFLLSLYARLAQWLVGVDPHLLARCSRAQQTLYSAMALLMLIAAVLTALGLSGKLIGLWEAGTLLTAAIFTLVLALALAMEAAVLSSISAGASVFTTLAVRIPIGLMLVALQAVPTLTNLLQHRIDLGLYEQHIVQQAALNGKTAALLDIAGVKRDALVLEGRHAEAMARQASPPEDRAIRDAVAAHGKAVAAQGRADAAVQAARRRVAGLRDAQAKAKPADVERLKASLARAEAAHEKARTAFNTATADADNAEAAVQQARKAQSDALAAAVNEARQALDAQAGKLAGVETRLAEEARKSEGLSAAASNRNFITEVTMLMRLAVGDWTVGLTLLFTIFGFALLDLLPTLLKVAARKGEYAMLAASGEQMRVSQARRDVELQRQDDEQILLIKRNQTRGVQQFVAQDNGALDGQQLLLERQRENDLMSVTATMELTSAALERLGQLQELLIAQHVRSQAHPDMAPAYRQQLAQLLAELEARARAMVTSSDGAGAAGTAPAGA